MTATPRTYVLRLAGHLDDHWSAWLGDVDMTHNPDGTTSLSISVVDQAQLHGLLAGLRDLGVTLAELRAVDRPTNQPRD